ncbi:hypothetical protein [Bradyrhizobium sp. SZCCHNRI1003]|uniref:hypothetical protein n=1 Tax=Bradyrhizobium sp. SZCCHNRI1003 TaxID=3057275 RepID=UPI002915D09B|nr:hypothetical protein [Bradyrhizobium sp. SZCCHNRI1003]
MRRRYCNRLPGRSRPLAAQPTIAAFIDSALTLPRAGLSGSALIKRMAEDMREAGHREGGITEDDLLRRGFTSAQIKLHAADARALAQQLAGASL